MMIERALSEIATITMGTSPKGDTYNQHGEGLPLLNGPTVIPPVGLLLRFCQLADDFHRQASTLHRQIQILRRTRDLLLPKLISGELDVSKINIRTAWIEYEPDIQCAFRHQALRTDSMATNYY